MTKIHPSSIVDPRAELGEGVEIGPFCVVEAGAVIGAGTVLEGYVCIKGGVRTGERCRFHEHDVIGGDPQDHDFKGEESFVIIGDDVTLRENITVNRATGEGCVTSIGSRCLIMESCHVAHNVRIGNDVTVTNKTGFSGHVAIDDFAVIGGMTGFHQFVRVGAYAMVGGMAKVIKDVPPYTMVDGHPAMIYGLNVVGLRRRGFSQDDRTKIKRIYREIRTSATGLAATLDAIDREHPGDAHAAAITSFFRESKRGSTKFFNGEE